MEYQTLFDATCEELKIYCKESFVKKSLEFYSYILTKFEANIYEAQAQKELHELYNELPRFSNRNRKIKKDIRL